MEPHSARTTADPGLIGLLGFIIATLTAQLAHLGVQSESAVFWVGAVFGGIVQVTAGMLSYFIGDDFHFIVYNAFGWYWICMPGFLLGGELGFFEVSGPARPLFSLIFSVLAFGFMFAGATHNTALPVTLLCVSIGLGLEAVGGFTGVDGWANVGAWFLIVASALAAYLLIEKFYWRTMGRHIIPLGRPWIAGGADREP
ncbi:MULTISPECIES: GPR1/FUN34/YaaH family transporter [unclassified Microbacterium]|uniref:acetate uptake transporter family protein n=1 Tax=unclassified Microbacterium TaxID=2609290 RepID=UPI000AD8FAD7|nr:MULTISPECIES: GPR1/FUN34/YaaH family transporter [unclassified Microbacterium]